MDVPLAPHPFEWDGCSGLMSALWRRIFKKPPPWEWFCAIHDWAYHHGGPDYVKDAADDALEASVKAMGQPTNTHLPPTRIQWLQEKYKMRWYELWAAKMHAAVHAGGLSWIPYMGARWGKGYDYPHRGPTSFHAPDGTAWTTPPFPYTRETLPKLRDELSGKEVNA